MTRRAVIFAIAATCAFTAGLPAAAQNPFGDMRQNYNAEQARDARRGGQVIPGAQARAIAMAQHPGAEYVNLTLGSDGQREVYSVRLRTRDGRIVEVVLDARTGAVLRR